MGTAYRPAYSTQRNCRTFAPHAAISSISSYLITGIRRAAGTILGSAVKMPSTSVYISQTSAFSATASATAERGDVLAVGGDTLEPGHDRDRPVGESAADPAGGHVDDPGPAVDVVGDHAGLGPGEGTRRQAQVGDRHREQRHRDPLAGGQKHVEFPGGGQRADPPGQI